MHASINTFDIVNIARGRRMQPARMIMLRQQLPIARTVTRIAMTLEYNKKRKGDKEIRISTCCSVQRLPLHLDHFAKKQRLPKLLKFPVQQTIISAMPVPGLATQSIQAMAREGGGGRIGHVEVVIPK